MTFEAAKGKGYRSDIAIDDVTLTSGMCSKFSIFIGVLQIKKLRLVIERVDIYDNSSHSFQNRNVMF